MTMIGAVSTFTKRPVLSVYGRTNIQTWKAFLIELKEILDEEHIKTKVWLVIDNLSVHHARVLRPFY